MLVSELSSACGCTSRSSVGDVGKPMIVKVRFIGGPFDGLTQGWNVKRKLPDMLRMSLELANTRGGMRLEVTSPSACGALLSHERAKDEIRYFAKEEGVYYFEPMAQDFQTAA